MTENTNTVVLSANNATVTALVTLIRTEIKAAGQQGRYAAYIAEFGVTRENVKSHAAALAALVTPVTPVTKDVDGKKVRTRYGNALNTAKTGLLRNMEKAETEQAVTLRVTLSGEGGGSTVIEPGHAMYESLVKMIRGE